MPYRKKLIEVALPLEAINAQSAREKSINHGHPSTLHLWWARRPLAACRAVLWASLVDDPSEYMPDEESANRERERLFELLEALVKWENRCNEDLLAQARLEIARSLARDLGCDVPLGPQAVREFIAQKAPAVLDPFAGGGSIPLEAQRLGLRAYASDLNPVAVLINKALIEIPPRFRDLPPVHPPDPQDQQIAMMKREWKGAAGLAEDVRFYGRWMGDEARKRIGHLYPTARITADLLAEHPELSRQGLMVGEELTVIAWLWARTVKCPNPACGAQMPLARSFALSTVKGKQAWVEPIVDSQQVRFAVRVGADDPPHGTVNRNGARCIVCNTPVKLDFIRSEGKAGRMAAKLMAIVAEGKNKRVYLPPLPEHEAIAASAKPAWKPDTDLPERALGFSVQLYGMNKHADLFTLRQLTALTTLSDLVGEARQKALADAEATGDRDPQAYADAIATYLAFGVDKGADRWSSICSWQINALKIRNTFARQAIPMVWDFAEANPFSESTSNWQDIIQWIGNVLDNLPQNPCAGTVVQANAQDLKIEHKTIISTDPPYYDNIGYADLADFFYIWLRHSLKTVHPELFSTLLVPKEEELVATPYRFNGDRQAAKRFFEDGLRQVFANLKPGAALEYPFTVYYAFKQTETQDLDDGPILFNGHASTGWETMLEGLLASGFEISGTWPMRTEMATRSVGLGTNALASSIVLVCRPRSADAPTATRGEFLKALKRELPAALRELQKSSIAPVDLAQAAIGPGMAIYSRYQQVLEADGRRLGVRTALALINQALDEYLKEQEGEYDADTRWALAWFEQYGFEEGPYGVAETLSKAKNTSVEGMVEAGFLEARGGKVRLLGREEMAADYDPAKDRRLTAWDAVQHLTHALDKQGEQGAAELLSKLGTAGETARDLAYRLYTICDRKGWAQEANMYNMLVVAWQSIKDQAAKRARQENFL